MEKYAASDVHVKRFKPYVDGAQKQARHVVSRHLRHRQLKTADDDAEGNLEASDEILRTPRAVKREDKNGFWTILGVDIYRHHVAPRGQLYVPHDSSFPIPMKYIDTQGRTWTNWRRSSLTISGTSMERDLFQKIGSDSLLSRFS